MTTIEQLEADIVELMYKHRLHMERNRRLKETGSEKYNEFLHGKSWGSLPVTRSDPRQSEKIERRIY